MTPTPLHEALCVFYLPPTEEYCGRSHTGIVFSVGRKWVHAVAFYATITCVELPRDSILKPVQLLGAPYEMARAARMMLDSRLPCTDRAREVLEDLAKLPAKVRNTLANRMSAVIEAEIMRDAAQNVGTLR